MKIKVWLSIALASFVLCGGVYLFGGVSKLALYDPFDPMTVHKMAIPDPFDPMTVNPQVAEYDPFDPMPGANA